ncbi:MAG: glycosyltransferase 87 family protein, partial [Microgenomates group bacterium]
MKTETKRKNMNFRLPFLKILIAGIVLRLMVMPITLHPDLLGHSFSAYFLAYEGKIDLYDTLASLPKDHPLVKNFGVSDIFIYPPLAYYTLGFFRILVKPFVDANFIPWLMENLGKIHSYPRLFENLFFFKLPYLFLDVGLAYLLAGLFEDQKKKKIAFALWMFNPVAIYVSFMIGQLDLLPTFFTVLALFMFKKKKIYWSAMAVGIAASYKMYPLFLLFPLAFLGREKLIERLKIIATGLAPFVFFIAPYLSSAAFRAQVFSPKSQKMLFMGWPVSGAEVIYPFVIAVTLICLYAYYSQQKLDLAVYFLAILLATYSVTHFHPQWFLWVTPFLIWELVENEFEHWFLILTIFICWLIITLFFEPSLSYGLFNPLWPSLDK